MDPLSIPAVTLTTVAGIGLAIVLALILRHGATEAQRQEEIRRLKAAYRTAWAEKRLHDARGILHELRRLGATTAWLVLAGTLAAAGCATRQPPAPLIIGERILMVSPGDTLEVPALLPPAVQWYVIDDVAASDLGLEALGVRP